MSEFSLYDTDGRRVDAAVDADKEIRNLIRSLSKSEFVDAYYNGVESFLCYRIEGKYTGPHSRGAREQSFYFVINGLDTLDSLQNEFTYLLASDDWTPAPEYGNIDRRPATDIQYLVQQPRDRNALGTRKQRLLGHMLADGESDLQIGVSSRDSALKLLALYSPIETKIIIGNNIAATLTERADLIVEYDHDSEFEPLNKSTKRRLSDRESEYEQTLINETLSDVNNYLSTLSKQTSTEAEIEALQQIQKELDSGGQDPPGDYPSVAQDIVTSVRNAWQDLDQKRQQVLISEIEEQIQTRINTIRTTVIDDSADRISETLQTEVERLGPLVSDKPSQLRHRLLNKAVPDTESTTGSKSQSGLAPKLYPPDIALGAVGVLILVLTVATVAVGAGIISVGQDSSPSNIDVQTSSTGSTVTVVGSAQTDTVELQLAEQGDNQTSVVEQSVSTKENGGFNTTLSNIDDGTYQLVVTAGGQRVTSPVTVDTPVTLSVTSPTWGTVSTNTSSVTTLEVSGTTNGTQIGVVIRNTTTGNMVTEQQLNVTDDQFSILFEDIPADIYHVEVRASNRMGSEATVTRTVQVVDSETSSSDGD